MSEFELKTLDTFYDVGMLRKLLENYPDNTPILVRDVPGLFLSVEELGYINLDNIESTEEEEEWNSILTANYGQEYMDY